jgi:hypothetical protein
VFSMRRGWLGCGVVTLAAVAVGCGGSGGAAAGTANGPSAGRAEADFKNVIQVITSDPPDLMAKFSVRCAKESGTDDIFDCDVTYQGLTFGSFRFQDASGNTRLQLVNDVCEKTSAPISALSVPHC